MPGEFSLRKDDGSLERGVSRDGELYFPLPPFEDGVDGIGDAGKHLSSLGLGVSCSRLGEGDGRGWTFWVASKICRSDNELRRFFLGGPVGMKLGCSPMVDKPRIWVETEVEVEGSMIEEIDLEFGPS